MGVKLGLDCKLYYCTAGIGGTPTWTEITAAREVNVPLSKGEADVSTRGGGGWKATKGTLKDASIDFDLLYDPADVAAAALLAAFLSGATIGLAAAHGPIATVGTEYFKADCEILKFEEKEPLDNAITVSVSAKPTYSANQPAFVTVAGT
jgi:hypothetical protein